MYVAKPYTDPETLRRMRVEDGLSLGEMADEFGVSKTTIHRHAERHGIDKPSKPYRDADTLRRLYWEEGKSSREIAAKFDVSKPTILKALRDFGIQIRKPNDGKMPPLFTDSWGYTRWKHEHDGDRYGVYVHRLLAVAEHGFDAVAGNDIHHKNGVSWDNRPANLEPIDHADHASKHHSD